MHAQDFMDKIAARLGDHFFVLFNEARIACRLPKQARAAALQIPGASEEPLPGWVWLPYDVDESVRKKYALAALRYAAKQNAVGEDPAVTMQTIRLWTRAELMPHPEKLNRKEWGF